MTLIETRGPQMFPVLDAAQIETARRFASGEARKFAPGELIYEVGSRHTPSWLVIEGAVDIVSRDGLQHEAAITTLGVGQFSGEVNQLAGRGTLTAARAGPHGCTLVPFDATHVRALGVALPYAIANAAFGGTAEYVALWFKSAGSESGFYIYASILLAIGFLVALTMPDPRKARLIDTD